MTRSSPHSEGRFSRPQHRRRFPYRYRPTLEALEDRYAPALLGLEPPASLADAAQVSILGASQNNPPFAADYEIDTSTNHPLLFFLRGDDGDPDLNQKLTFTLDQLPAHGVIQVFSPKTGKVLYKPDKGFSGFDSFSYTITDSGGAVSLVPTVVTIGVESNIKPPKLNVKDAKGDEATPIPLKIDASLKGNANDATLQVSITGVPGDGSLSVGTKQSDGTWLLTPNDLPQLSFTLPHPGSFTLTVTATAANADGEQQSVIKSLKVTVKNVPPTLLAPGSVILPSGQPLAQAISLSDPGDEPLTLSIDYGDGTPPFAVEPPPSDITLSHPFQLPDGAAQHDFFVKLDAFDGTVHVVKTMVVHVFSTKPNHVPPTLVAPSSLILQAGVPLNQSVLLADPDGDPLSLTIDYGDGTPALAVQPQASEVVLAHTFQLPGGVDEKDFFVQLDAFDGTIHVQKTMVVHVFSAKQVANLDHSASIVTDGIHPGAVSVEWSNQAVLKTNLNAPAGWSLFVAGYTANPTPGNNGPNPNGQSFVTITAADGTKTKVLSAGFFDVRASGAATAQGVEAFVTVSFLVSPDQATTVKLFAWNGTVWLEATSALPIQREISPPDASGKVRVTLTYLFTADTFPSVYKMTETIFTLAITATPALPQTVPVSQPVVQVSADPALTAVPPPTVQSTFTSTNQLNLVFQTSQRTNLISLRTEASTLPANNDIGGNYQVNLEQFEDVGWMFRDWTPPASTPPRAGQRIDAPMPPVEGTAQPPETRDDGTDPVGSPESVPQVGAESAKQSTSNNQAAVIVEADHLSPVTNASHSAAVAGLATCVLFGTSRSRKRKRRARKTALPK